MVGKDKEFEELMWGVKPLDKAKDREVNVAPKKLPTRSQLIHHEQHLDEDALVGKAVKFIGAVRANKSTKKVKVNKHLTPDATLDLHGFTLEEAENLTKAFVANAQAAGDRAIIIITGKGLNSGAAGAVLKNGIWDFLSWELPESIHFQWAPRHLGGEGAILILL